MGLNEIEICVEEFELAILKAKKDGKDVFIYKGEEFVLRYAEYMLEYIKNK